MNTHDYSPYKRSDCRCYRGVTFERASQKWRARLYCQGRHTTLGRFETALQAACAHDRAAYFVLKEEALTNFGLAAAKKDAASGQPPSTSARTMSHLLEIAKKNDAINSKRALRTLAAAQSGAMRGGEVQERCWPAGKHANRSGSKVAVTRILVYCASRIQSLDTIMYSANSA
jgi:hypothetical protein